MYPAQEDRTASRGSRSRCCWPCCRRLGCCFRYLLGLRKFQEQEPRKFPGGLRNQNFFVKSLTRIFSAFAKRHNESMEMFTTPRSTSPKYFAVRSDFSANSSCVSSALSR